MRHITTLIAQKGDKEQLETHLGELRIGKNYGGREYGIELKVIDPRLEFDVTTHLRTDTEKFRSYLGDFMVRLLQCSYIIWTENERKVNLGISNF